MPLRLSMIETFQDGRCSSSKCASHPFQLRLSVSCQKFLQRSPFASNPSRQAPKNTQKCAFHLPSCTTSPTTSGRSIQSRSSQTAERQSGLWEELCNCWLRPMMVERVEIRSCLCTTRIRTRCLNLWNSLKCYFELKRRKNFVSRCRVSSWTSNLLP